MSNPARILNRIIGTCSGLDACDDYMVIQWYDFIPAPGVNLPASEILSADCTEGLFETWDDDSNATASFDMITILAAIPVA